MIRTPLGSMLALVAALVAGNTWAAQTGLEPGNWKLKVASTVNGKPEPEQNTQDCLHADHLKDLGAYFAPDLEGVKAKCTKTQQPTGDAAKLAYKMRCTQALRRAQAGGSDRKARRGVVLLESRATHVILRVAG